MGYVRLSEKHGLNPMLIQCYFCMEDVGVGLPGRLPGDAQAPRRACLDKEPCDKCKRMMEMGVILISVKSDITKAEEENPYRTGGWVVVRDEVIRRMVSPELAEQILKKRMAFVPDDAWDKIGLPRGPVEGVPSEVPQ